jgi:hypothetical protein
MKIRDVAPLAILVALLGACAPDTVPTAPLAPATPQLPAAAAPVIARSTSPPIAGTSAPPPTVANTTPTPQTAIVGNLGQRIESAGVALTVEAVTTEKVVDSFYRARDGNTFLILDVVIENVGENPVRFNANYFEVKGANNRTYIPGIAVTAHALKYGELDPGEQTSGQVAFEIPESASGLISNYESSEFAADFLPLQHRLN